MSYHVVALKSDCLSIVNLFCVDRNMCVAIGDICEQITFGLDHVQGTAQVKLTTRGGESSNNFLSQCFSTLVRDSLVDLNVYG